MCTFIQITFWPLARGNNQINSAKIYHRFLNKKNLSQNKIIILMTYFSKTRRHISMRGTENPIDDIDVICSIADVGREL